MNITNNDHPISSDSEKEALKFILDNVFRSGFGILNKTEIDLILFTTILRFSDQKDLSDLALSKYLQITQQRIRNLKEKASVKYMLISRSEAIEYFIEKSSDAKPDEEYIDIPIYDVAVKNEIEAILDENNILLHKQLNTKIFRLRLDDFLELTIQIELVSNPESKIDEIESKVLQVMLEKRDSNEQFANLFKNKDGGLKELTKSSLKEALVKGSLSFGVDLLASLIPGGAFFSDPVKKLLKNIEGKV